MGTARASRSHRRRAGLPLVGVILSLIFAPHVALAQAAPACGFTLGFQTLDDLIPTHVGDCLDDETHDGSGDAVQHTVGGLLVWRKADNWTAFTDGFQTWINGPYGLAERLNTQRFSWEANPEVLPVIGAGVAASAPSPADATLLGPTVVTENKKTVAIAALAGHSFFASSSKRARTLYCDDDPARSALSAARTLTFPSFAAAIAALPNDKLHRPC